MPRPALWPSLIGAEFEIHIVHRVVLSFEDTVENPRVKARVIIVQRVHKVSLQFQKFITNATERNLLQRHLISLSDLFYVLGGSIKVFITLH